MCNDTVGMHRSTERRRIFLNKQDPRRTASGWSSHHLPHGQISKTLPFSLIAIYITLTTYHSGSYEPLMTAVHLKQSQYHPSKSPLKNYMSPLLNPFKAFIAHILPPSFPAGCSRRLPFLLQPTSSPNSVEESKKIETLEPNNKPTLENFEILQS